MAEATPALRKPVFTKVNELRPGTNGHSLNVKVISTKTVMQRGGGRPSGPQARQMRIAECLVGDETGIIICKKQSRSEHNSYRNSFVSMALIKFYSEVI